MRPKDWEKTLREILDRFNVTYMNSEECKLIEAGADAYEEGLKKQKIGIAEAMKRDKYDNGYLVFIEE